jgi:hypothetical protein
MTSLASIKYHAPYGDGVKVRGGVWQESKQRKPVGQHNKWQPEVKAHLRATSPVVRLILTLKK